MNPLISRIELANFLSFGPDFPGIDLGPLNVLVGPNGSGKSNLIEAISFMRSAPTSFQDTVRKGGGVDEWIWKGSGEAQVAAVDFHFLASSLGIRQDGRLRPEMLRHLVEFGEKSQVYHLSKELIETRCKTDEGRDTLIFDYDFSGRKPRASFETRSLTVSRDRIPESDQNTSVLSQITDLATRSEFKQLIVKYKRVMIYREWVFGRNAVFREPQRADMQKDVLAEDFSNLGLFLNRLKVRFPAAKRKLLEHLRDLYEGITDFEVNIDGGTVQVYFTEGDYSIPATRLSDGTLRYLCLLAILCDPEPPPLVCIEEPELGLHPDIIPKIADMLVELSERTQVIVTTHSDILIDSMTERPEAVIVCEKHNGQTEMKRLKRDDLEVWLKEYRLGQLWTKGEIGGTRW